MPTLELTRNGKAKRDLNYHEIARLLRRDGTDLVVERTRAMKGQGLSSTFAFGKATGAIIGAAAANFWRVHAVAPVTWRKAVGFKTIEVHAASRALVTHLFLEALGTIRGKTQ